ncbi:ATP-binding protein [Paenibacillus sp. NFR01]|uniref:ATP-binding protein n=1 Tax=Paenibacillus sp. NFR01 TaxID=1566279 RepID=UPI0008C4D060|nr:ATP-binding protein [Paenibacillus sp. NFR01]SEU29264.1 Signal transduction histidine kinase, nitrogen specific [Paenibacillus sp. NFR01]
MCKIQGVIAIIYAVMDILLQISAASSFLILLQWWLDQGRPHPRIRFLADAQSVLAVSCALSVTFCTLLSSSLFGAVYLNLAIIPAYLGVLYASTGLGLYLMAYFLLCTVVYSAPAGISDILLYTGFLLYPLLFSIARSSFKHVKMHMKIILLWSALFPAMLFITLAPRMGGGFAYDLHSSEGVLVALYLGLAMLLGGIFIYYIETALERRQSREYMTTLNEQMRRESEKLQQITEVVQLNMMTMADGYITELNEFMLRLIQQHYPGISRETIMAQPAIELFGKNMDEDTLSRLSRVIRHQQRTNSKIVYDCKTYLIYTAPLLGEADRNGGVVIIAQDLTAEEKMRSELDNAERLTLVGQMAAGITHEIRNPMAVVRGFLQLMREKSPDELDSYYQIVMEELDRANSIINDFLSLAQSRISDKEIADLHHVIEDLAPLLWADANLRGQSVELQLDPALPLLRLNVREIKQMILNLARNAMEAMGPKGVLTMVTRTIGGNVELIIKDTGSGIPEDMLKNMFVPFFTTKDQGTGLGLPLCLSIAERHQGKIHVDSAMGQGTTITVSFPVEIEEAVSF